MPQFGGVGRWFAVEQHQPAVPVVRQHGQLEVIAVPVKTTGGEGCPPARVSTAVPTSPSRRLALADAWPSFALGDTDINILRRSRRVFPGRSVANGESVAGEREDGGSGRAPRKPDGGSSSDVCYAVGKNVAQVYAAAIQGERRA